MKTNLSNLMSIANDEERKFVEYGYELKDYAYSITTQELDGTINIIEDRKKDFEKAYKNYTGTQQKLTKIKSIMYQKNNSLKLPDGRTIQEAIVENANLRKMKVIYAALLTKKDTKQRITEVHNSYFECKNINFNSDKLQKEYELLEKKIQDTDFEISKLNSIEFDLDI